MGNAFTAPGWIRDEHGALRRETIHHMGRRLPDFDYSARRIYEITIALAERRPILGELVKRDVDAEGEVSEAWDVAPSALGDIVLECWRNISVFWPQIELIEDRLMPDHFHGILFVKEQLPKGKTLGNVIGSFKSRSTSAALKYFAARGEEPNRAARGEVPGVGHFSAIGNHFLLQRPELRQVQVSRADFAYRRERLPSGAWRVLRDAKGDPLVEKTTPAFEEKAARLLAAAKHGAVLVSPAISHGEREIARRAYVAGYRVIALQNKGFSPIYKPGGKLFDHCAAGNLLLLAPIAWPYVPGDKPPTRESSQVLNRIAQLISGEGAVEINYKGAVMSGIDQAVAAALSPQKAVAQGREV